MAARWTTSCWTALPTCSAARARARLADAQVGELPNGKPQLKDFYVSGGATLWGGNLAVLVSLLGTPYFPQIEGGVLFLEDVGEHPYKIERMLNQLLLAGCCKSKRPSSGAVHRVQAHHA
jgi:muramoyltetrapeptide carboxypeptidase LdcA involved in peptidoglycan recycling